MSILPDILDIASSYQLKMKSNPTSRGEIRVCCPFCIANIGKDDLSFHMYLNPQEKIFKCMRCNETGGVVKLQAMLSGKSETELLEEYRSKTKTNKRNNFINRYPAAKLTATQLKLIGIQGKPNWVEEMKIRPDYTKRVLRWIWNEWLAFLEYEREYAYRQLIIGIQTLTYQRACQEISQRSREIGHDLLKEVQKIYSSRKRPEWAVHAEEFIKNIKKALRRYSS